jgi:hypothetical protein
MVALALASWAAPAARAAGPPFTQCPSVGASPSCEILVQINADKSVTVLHDPGVGQYDGADDTLVGVQNNSGGSIAAITVTGPGSGLSQFDGDGICTFSFTGDGYCDSQQKAGTDPHDYQGPGTSFVTSASEPDSAEIDFANGLAAGGSTYFSLEGALTSATITARLGHLGYNYVALGDSFSSGEGNPPFVLNGENTDTRSDQCHRSPKSYPALLDTNPGILISSFADKACSGATREDVWLGKDGEPSQLSALTPQTNLVTISVGGNDADFSTVLGDCITGPATGGSANCQKKMVKDQATGKWVTLDSYETSLINDLGVTSNVFCPTPGGYVTCSPSLHELYEDIAAKSAPGVKMIVLLYPHLFTTAPGKRGCTIRGAAGLNFSGATYTISQANITWLNKGVENLNHEITTEVALARQAGVDISAVDPTGDFGDDAGGASPGGHGVCTAQPWIHGLVLAPHGDVFDPKSFVSPYSFHPNATGQATFAGEVASAIG